MSGKLTCVLKLGDFLDCVFESLLFSYGDRKSVIQKLQNVVGCFMCICITYKGYTSSLFVHGAWHLQEVKTRP